MVIPSIIHVIPPTICFYLAVYMLYMGRGQKAFTPLILFLLTLTAYGIVQVIKQDQMNLGKVEKITSWGIALWGLLVPLSFHSMTALFNDKKRKNKIILVALYLAGAVIMALSLNGYTIYSDYRFTFFGWEAKSDYHKGFFWLFYLFLLSGIPLFILTLHAVKSQTANYQTQKLAQAMLVNYLYGAIFTVIPYCLLSFFEIPMEVILDYFEVCIMTLIVLSIQKYQPENGSHIHAFSGITCALPAEIMLVSPEKTIVSTNKDYFYLTGYHRHELEGKPFNKLFIDNVLIEKELEKINQDRYYFASFETECFLPDKSPHRFKISISGIYSTYNDLSAYMITFNGIEQNVVLEHLQTMFHLSTREKAITDLLIKGYTNPEISDQLFISLNTIKTHSRNIYQKTGTANRAELKQLIEQIKT